jgi:hypothetical protein
MTAGGLASRSLSLGEETPPSYPKYGRANIRSSPHRDFPYDPSNRLTT